MDPRLAAALAAGLAALAGCGAAGLAGPTATPTSAPVHVAAPGLSAGGVEDPARLAAAHRASLEGVSYTHWTALVIRGPDGTVRAERTTTVRVAADRPAGRAFRLERRASGTFPEAMRPQVDVSAWSPGAHTYVRVDPATRQARYTRYDGGLADAVVVLDGDEAVGIYLVGLSNASVEETTVDGWLAYRLEATAPSGRHTVAVVDAFGLLRSLEVVLPAGELPWIRQRGTVVRRVAHDRVGTTTVRRPGWVDEAILATAADGESD